MIHVDLFSGIGGFSLALDRVFYEQPIKHIFVEWDDFCREVLKKHWPEAEYHKDIHEFIADTKYARLQYTSSQVIQKSKEGSRFNSGEVQLITGGFPCQPFSQAGRRKGTDDDRYLWPAMYECIALFRPEWVIAENVAGLVTWNDGLVLETVCADLEKEGYEVQPFVIPACAVGAPHRRDRVWIVGHAKYNGFNGTQNGESSNQGSNNNQKGQDEICKSEGANSVRNDAKDSLGCRGSGRSKVARQVLERQSSETETPRPDSESRTTDTKRTRHEGNEHKAGRSTRHSGRPQWDTHWFEVATRLCRVDDGLPRRLDRNPRLKALGNAIVPQVAEEIFKAIKSFYA